MNDEQKTPGGQPPMKATVPAWVIKADMFLSVLAILIRLAVFCFAAYVGIQVGVYGVKSLEPVALALILLAVAPAFLGGKRDN